MVFSFPIVSGNREHRTPTGYFRIDAFKPPTPLVALHESKRPTPPTRCTMRCAFSSTTTGSISGSMAADVSGFPASHGCVGLYDEEMQRKILQVPPATPARGCPHPLRMGTWGKGGQRQIHPAEERPPGADHRRVASLRTNVSGTARFFHSHIVSVSLFIVSNPP